MHGIARPRACAHQLGNGALCARCRYPQQQRPVISTWWLNPLGHDGRPASGEDPRTPQKTALLYVCALPEMIKECFKECFTASPSYIMAALIHDLLRGGALSRLDARDPCALSSARQLSHHNPSCHKAQGSEACCVRMESMYAYLSRCSAQWVVSPLPQRHPHAGGQPPPLGTEGSREKVCVELHDVEQEALALFLQTHIAVIVVLKHQIGVFLLCACK